MVEAGNFSTAAERLGLAQSAAGKEIVRQERCLNVQLFNRSVRAQTLTAEGVLHYSHCLRALEEIRLGDSALADGQIRVAGHLRIGEGLLRECLFAAQTGCR